MNNLNGQGPDTGAMAEIRYANVGFYDDASFDLVVTNPQSGCGPNQGRNCDIYSYFLPTSGNNNTDMGYCGCVGWLVEAS